MLSEHGMHLEQRAFNVVENAQAPAAQRFDCPKRCACDECMCQASCIAYNDPYCRMQQNC